MRCQKSKNTYRLLRRSRIYKNLRRGINRRKLLLKWGIMKKPTQKRLKLVKDLEKELHVAIMLVKGADSDEFIQLYNVIRYCRDEIREITGDINYDVE